SDARNRERADPDEPTKDAADGGTRAGTGGDAFRRLRVDLVREILGGVIAVRQNRRDVAIPEPGGPKRFECALERQPIRIHAVRNQVRCHEDASLMGGATRGCSVKVLRPNSSLTR